MTGGDPQDERGRSAKPLSEPDLSRRLERLGSELEARRPAAASAPGAPGKPADPSAMGRAFRASTEFVAGVIAGGALGWLVDKGLGISPWGLIVFLLLGFAAGIYNVMRTSGFLASSSGVDGARSRRD